MRQKSLMTALLAMGVAMGAVAVQAQPVTQTVQSGQEALRGHGLRGHGAGISHHGASVRGHGAGISHHGAGVRDHGLGC